MSVEPVAPAQQAAALSYRRVDGLFDLRLTRSPDGDLTSPRHPLGTVTARQLAEAILDGGGAGDDVRMLVDDGARSAALFGEVAGLLGRDVLFSPAGTSVAWRRMSDDGLTDAVPVDATGRTADWRVVQPPELATPLPGWFVLADGVVRRRRGTVALPLPGGLALATRADFAARRAAAFRLGTGHPGLTTVAVTVRGGGFLVGDYDGTHEVRSGPGLAASVADLPLFGTDLRLWLAWPSEPAEQDRLAAHLTELAVLTGATVWTPPVGGVAHVVDGCADLGALDTDGHPAGWHAYPRGEAPHGGFGSDRDGRLMPTGPITVTGTPRAAVDGLFHADPGVLADGRPAARRTDGSLVALGPGEVAGLLRQLGWRGEDVALHVPADPGLFSALDVDVWAPPPGAGVDGDGRVTGNHEWQLLHRATPTPSRVTGWRSSEGALVPAPVNSFTAGAPQVHHHQTPPDAPAVPRPATEPHSGQGAPHGVEWLPARPPVNAAPFELYVACTTTPSRAVEDGVPSPDLFLLGRLEPRAVVESRAVQHLLRVRVEAGAAVDLTLLGTRVPSHIQHLANVNGLFLLPVGWLSRVHAQAGYALTASGTTCVDRFTDAPVTIRSSGARHGIEGLPNDVVRWPDSRHQRAYALLPDTADTMPTDWLTLFEPRPKSGPGFRLVELRVPRRRAIDTVRTADLLGPLTALRSRLDELRATGTDLALPRRAFDRVVVRRVYVPGPRGWRRAPRTAVAPLADLVRRPAEPQRPAGPADATDDDRDRTPAAARE